MSMCLVAWTRAKNGSYEFFAYQDKEIADSIHVIFRLLYDNYTLICREQTAHEIHKILNQDQVNLLGLIQDYNFVPLQVEENYGRTPS